MATSDGQKIETNTGEAPIALQTIKENDSTSSDSSSRKSVASVEKLVNEQPKLIS